MIVVGLDLSLARTGVASCSVADFAALPDEPRRTATIITGSGAVTTSVLSASRKLSDVERLIWLRDQILGLLPDDGRAVVALEGYSYGSHQRNHQLGELGGVVRVMLHEQGVPWVVVAPPQLKKYATGKGNAGKDLVLTDAVRRLDFPGADNNEADALWLCTMTLDHYRFLVSPVPAAHRAVLEKVKWPDLR